MNLQDERLYCNGPAKYTRYCMCDIPKIVVSEWETRFEELAMVSEIIVYIVHPQLSRQILGVLHLPSISHTIKSYCKLRLKEGRHSY